MTYTCPKDYYPTKFEQDQDSSTASTCPEYIKWIHEDLKPWKRTGITREMMERGRNVSYFRLVIKQGKAYAEMLYPGNVPDLELLFETGDKPVVGKEHFQGTPPPIFHYCGHKNAYDIVFPDWSFWGW
ncbi:hypothetical protein D0Y65_049462 [Glycine soja]|uniref:Glycosyl transferase CAP10 domain-containing protein n=1 Tax=Glycine soja TaxID=3848 RepID=A0A445FXN1_GLYSO|nr:hypothetical protein D0Y65_049462 [Glycine soja]